MQIPSANFNALREAAGNHITQKAVIDIGNYALTSKGAIAIASTEFSADWPAIGPINGDLTHINAGAAGVADDGIGGSVWQGSVVANGSGNLSPNETFLLDLGQDRRINRLTLIFWPDSTKNGNLGSIGWKDFTIQYGDDSGGLYGGGGFGGGGYGGLANWTGLVDKSPEIGKSAVTISGGAVTGNTNDMVVFEDPTPQTARYIYFTVSKLQAASVRARLVAVKVTLAVDVSDAVTAVARQRKKDYHLERRTATVLQMTLRNFDGRFNDRVTPTSDQIAAGWFNNLIRPNLEIRYFAGFSGVNCQMFTGFIDSWEPDSGTKLVRTQARDFFKFLIKAKLTTKLKTGQSLESLFEYVCNLQNFPSNLMLLDTTTISPAYFMPKDQSIQQIVNDLTDATGNGEVYVDEFGRLNFRSYLNIIAHIWFQGRAQGDFAAGTNVDGHVDWTTTPGRLLLANVAGVYYREGNWYSALSPVFSGKVEFTTFLASIESAASNQIDFFLRVTEDGGVTYTPWREILPGSRGLISKWNHWYGQIQVWARLRTSDTSTTPALLDFTVKYRSRGGSSMVNNAADWATKDSTTLLALRRKLTDEVGGVNYLITEAIVKSTPTFLAASATDAWQGTFNGNPISPTNPLYVPLGDTSIPVDFGSFQYYPASQAVVVTLGTAVATAVLSDDPSKPLLTITATTAGTITGLKITGKQFIQTGQVIAVTEANLNIIADYGHNPDVLQNNYIDNVDLAQSIADQEIALFGQGPLDWIQEAMIRFSPNAQLNDRVTVTDGFAHVADDYVAIGLDDEITIGSGNTFTASTRAELVKIGAGFSVTQAAHYGSGGQFYYSGFRFGGSYPI